MQPAFNFTKISDYGTENYIVARLSLQIFQILGSDCRNTTKNSRTHFLFSNSKVYKG